MIDGIAIICFEVADAIVAREQAEAASRAKDEFIAMLGHGLRKPNAAKFTDSGRRVDTRKIQKLGLDD